jgi:hypothetical protein
MAELLEPPIDRRIALYGGNAEFFLCEDGEVLLEAGAGTGKTYTGLRKIDAFARSHPGCRILLCRKTRVSMNESVLPQWEQEVLWPGHEAFRGTATREHRTYYEYNNGSRVVLGGLDNVDRIMSSQYDLILVVEATEITLEDWEKLTSRLRNGMAPYSQAIADVNPGPEFHWLNKRAKRGAMTRILSRHTDNPRWYDHELEDWTEEGLAYQARLDKLTGVRRRRLRDHEWVSADGPIWPEFDSRKHDDDNISMLNDRIGGVTGRPYARVAIKALKARKAGWDQVSELLQPLAGDTPMMYFVEGCLRHTPDPSLEEGDQPTCTVEEIPSYVWMETRDGQRTREEPSPTAADHGCDTTRYAAMYVWKHDLSPAVPEKKFQPGTYGKILRHNKVGRKKRR